MTVAPTKPPRARWVVLKFGGTSVAAADGWRSIAAACRAALAEGRRPVVVCSALAGVSDRIDALVTEAATGAAPGPGLEAIARAHRDLARALGIPLPAEVAAGLDELRTGLAGIALVREASPRVRARLMALGEQMSTRLGHAALAAEGIDLAWADARALLRADDPPGTPEGPRFLSARSVALHPDAAAALDPRGVLTQGFVASDPTGATVLLGRGGSDRTAALLGAGLSADRVEIWTDVPGLFTGNPSVVPRARHLPRMGYDEAEVLGALGGRVLHPATVAPVREAGVPLVVRSTFRPDLPGTTVDGAPSSPGVQAVTSRSGLLLFRMERPARWQPVGFLADVAGCFARAGVSIDLLSTSAGTILATVDPAAAPATHLDALLADLGEVCTARVRERVASVSLVGPGATRFATGPVLAAVREAAPRMVVPGASGLHLTFVVDEDRARPLSAHLHRLLFEGPAPAVPGPAWCDLPAQVAP